MIAGIPLPALLEALASGTTSSVAVTESYLARITAVNPAINAYTHVAGDAARFAARESDDRRARGAPLSAFDGVPVALKASIAVRSWPWTAGFEVWRERLAAHDARIVTRLRELGCVLLGLTNMDEGGLGATTMNAAFGYTHHPRGPGRSPGGSSGGSAAAVAAELCAFAIGTDTIGSLRIPAAYCGIATLKPTHGVIDMSGIETAHARFDHAGPLVRSAEDLEPVSSALLPASLTRPAATRGNLRIGVLRSLEPATESQVAADYAAALEKLRAQGHQLVALDPGAWELGRLRRAIFSLVEHEVWRTHRDLLEREPGDYSPSLRAMLEFGGRQATADLERHERRIGEFTARLVAAMNGLDALATPTAPQVAFAHDDAVPANSADYTAIASACGWPATSVPMQRPAEAWPSGLQFIARAGNEALLLDLVGSYAAGADTRFA